MPSPTLPEPARNEPRGGRDLPAAIATGAALLVPAVIGILFFVEVLILLFSVLLCLGVWEVARALKGQGYNVPVVPLCVGSVGMLVAAYFAAEEGLVLSFAVTSALILVWVWVSSAVRATPIGAEKPRSSPPPQQSSSDAGCPSSSPSLCCWCRWTTEHGD
ncbi:hypothetical protein [Nesterenkonia pannonica]|uniref:hypothetical protein n=1 Tax=Nesterenkonia pannonica TaxID=1548602 RepID=UPI0021645CEF|nr:hypothetical protein [Nesterenkonia pannonica]